MKYLFLLCFIFFNSNKVYSEEITPNTVLDIINYEWWYNFNDRNLERYILKGIISNNDLKISNLKIKEYNNFVKYTFGQELPTISANFNYSKTDNLPSPLDSMVDKDGMILPITMSYELDLFGKNRLKTKSTKKQLEIYNLQLQSSYISYVSSLATVYLNIVRYNELLSLYDELISINKLILENKKLVNKNGLNDKNTINTAEQDLKNIMIQKTNILKNRDVLLTQFSVLLGEDIKNELKISDYKDITFKEEISSEMSSDVIFSRPDVLAMEKQLEKANIDIKVARREFLPTFTLSASVFFNNITAGGFFSNPISNLVGSIGQKLFVGGRKKLAFNMQKNKYEQLFEEYKKITLQATKEVNDSLVNVKYNENIFNMNSKNLLLEIENYSNQEIKNKNGLISNIELLQYKQKLITNKINVVNARIENYIDYITLYKSVGGRI